MKRIAFNPRFVNADGTDLAPGKIHTLRRNYYFWHKFEGRDVALFTWEGVPYRSKQRVFCVKHIYHVQWIMKERGCFYLPKGLCDLVYAPIEKLAKNDGLDDEDEFTEWFSGYPNDEMAILHFTEFRYGEGA
jgi:hypothetical protein